jgi:hypothetical protein
VKLVTNEQIVEVDEFETTDPARRGEIQDAAWPENTIVQPWERPSRVMAGSNAAGQVFGSRANSTNTALHDVTQNVLSA